MEIIVAVGFVLLILCAFGLSDDLEKINNTLRNMETVPPQQEVIWDIEVREMK